MPRCDRTLSGAHIYAQRGARGSGWFRCACGQVADRATHFARMDRIEIHRAIRCPCEGDVAHCDELTARDQVQWAGRRIGYAELALIRARHGLEDAVREYREAETRLLGEHEHRAELEAALGAILAQGAALLKDGA